MDGARGTNGNQDRKSPRARRDSLSRKLAGQGTASIQDLWDRIDALYDDTALGVFTVSEAAALSRIVGRQISLLGIASTLDRRQEMRSNLKLLAKKD